MVYDNGCCLQFPTSIVHRVTTAKAFGLGTMCAPSIHYSLNVLNGSSEIDVHLELCATVSVRTVAVSREHILILNVRATS